MSKRKRKSNLDKIQPRRTSSRISDICSQSSFLCSTPNKTLNVTKQLFPKSSSQNPSHSVEPIIVKPTLCRKSSRILNQSISRVSDTNDKMQTRRKSIRISDICSQSSFLCSTPNKTLNVSKQVFPKSSSRNPSHSLEPIIVKPDLRRKSLRILNHSQISSVSDSKDHKQIALKKNVSKKIQERRNLFKRRITVSSMKSAVINSSKLKPPSITLTSNVNHYIKPGSVCKDFKDLDHLHPKKMEISIMLENKKNCKNGLNLKNSKFRQMKRCSISQRDNTDASVLSELEQSILKIKRMSKEEVLSMINSKSLSREERVALKKRKRALQFYNSVRVKSPSRTSLSVPSSPTIKHINSIRKHSLQWNHTTEFAIPMNLKRESLSKGLYHQSPSKCTSNNKVKQVLKPKTPILKVNKATIPTRKSKRKRISKEQKAKQDTESTSQELGSTLQLARVGTLKRKRQIRQILATHSSTQTLLESTPMKCIKFSRIAFVDAMSPMSFGTPIAPKPKRTKKSPRVFTPTNRANQDRYIKELERRKKNNIDKPITEMWGESSQVSTCEDLNKEELKMLCDTVYESDSDASVDDYLLSELE